MRVLFANVAADLGGAEQVILSLAERLPAQGVEVSFAIFRPGPLEDVLRRRGIKVHVFPKSYRFRQLASVVQCVRWLADCIEEDGANLLHSNLTAHLIGSWAARLAKVPEVWQLHDYPFKFDAVHSICRLLPADHYIFTTEFLKQGETSLAKRPHTVVNPNCVDVVELRTQQLSTSIGNRLGIQQGKYFLTIARLQEHKGHRYLLEAIAQLAPELPEVKWIIAGKANGPEQEKYLSELKADTVQRGLADRVLFPGFIPDEEKASIFKGAIALVHPATTEGYGLVLLESMAYGTPVIAAASSGPAEIIANESNGLLVPVKDGEALSHAMRRLYRDRALALRLSDQAEQDVAGKSVDVMVAETIEVYRRTFARAEGKTKMPLLQNE